MDGTGLYSQLVVCRYNWSTLTGTYFRLGVFQSNNSRRSGESFLMHDCIIDVHIPRTKCKWFPSWHRIGAIRLGGILISVTREVIIAVPLIRDISLERRYPLGGYLVGKNVCLIKSSFPCPGWFMILTAGQKLPANRKCWATARLLTAVDWLATSMTPRDEPNFAISENFMRNEWNYNN